MIHLQQVASTISTNTRAAQCCPPKQKPAASLLCRLFFVNKTEKAESKAEQPIVTLICSSQHFCPASFSAATTNKFCTFLQFEVFHQNTFPQPRIRNLHYLQYSALFFFLCALVLSFFFWHVTVDTQSRCKNHWQDYSSRHNRSYAHAWASSSQMCKTRRKHVTFKTHQQEPKN